MHPQLDTAEAGQHRPGEHRLDEEEEGRAQEAGGAAEGEHGPAKRSDAEDGILTG